MTCKIASWLRTVLLLPLAVMVGQVCAAREPALRNDPPRDHGPVRLVAGSDSQPVAVPLAVFVHGGGWVAGTPSMGDPMLPFFASRRIAFRAIDYPKRPFVPLAQMIRSVRGQLADAAATGPLIVLGHSAGAQLAAAATFGPGAPTVRCLILLDGIGYDLVGMLADGLGFQDRLGLSPALAAPYSPTALVPDSQQRPAVFIAAGNDWRGTADQARAFARVLEGNGLDVTLRVFLTAEHADFLHEFSDPDSQVAKNVAAFLAAHPRCLGRT